MLELTNLQQILIQASPINMTLFEAILMFITASQEQS